MASTLHLLPMPSTTANLRPGGIYAPGTPLLIPLGMGLVAGIQEHPDRSTPRFLTTEDLLDRDVTVGALWAEAAWEMLSTLSQLTSTHGTALRHRRLRINVREIGVLDDAFPAAGLVAHPLLVRPLLRLLGSESHVSVTSSGRLIVHTGRTEPLRQGQLSAIVDGEACSPFIDIAANSSWALLQKVAVGALE